MQNALGKLNFLKFDNCVIDDSSKDDRLTKLFFFAYLLLNITFQ